MEADATLNERKRGRKWLHVMGVTESKVQGSGHACGGPMGLVSSRFLVRRYAKANKTGNYRLTY